MRYTTSARSRTCLYMLRTRRKWGYTVTEEAGKDLYTVTEAAEELGISVSAVQVRLRRGQMQGIRPSPRIWLVARTEIERWRDRGRLKPGRPRKELPAADLLRENTEHLEQLEEERRRIRGEEPNP